MTKPIDVAFPVGMNAIAEKNDGRRAAGIDPDGSAGEPGVADTLTDWKQRATIARIGRIDIPAIATQSSRNRMRRCHLPNRRLSQDSAAIQFASVKQHSSIESEIIGRREKPCMTGDATQGICPRIVDFA